MSALLSAQMRGGSPAWRTDAGYRVFGLDAVARARLIRTLRELGMGLDDIKRVLAAETSLVDVAAEHARALEVVERLEAMSPEPSEDGLRAAERVKAFSYRRVGRYWTLVGIVNGLAPSQAPEDIVDSWEWYGRALRAHA